MRTYRILVYTAIFVIVIFSSIYSYLFGSNSSSISNIATQKRILLISSVYQNPYWQIIKRGADDAAHNRGCFIEYNGPQTLDTNASLKIFDMGIATSVDGIITSAQEEKQYIPMIKKAMNKGIPVVTIDTDAKKSSRIAYVGTNNIEAGNYAGQQLLEITFSKAKIGIVMAGMNTTSQVERVEGFKNYISDYPGMKIIAAESSNSDVIEAELVAKKMMNEHPEIDCLYCTSSVDGIGAARAVIDSNRKGKIKIVCFDDLPETLEFIKEGIIQASVVQKPYEMGFDSVNILVDKLEGKNISGEFPMGSIVVTKDNVYNYNLEKGEMN